MELVNMNQKFLMNLLYFQQRCPQSHIHNVHQTNKHQTEDGESQFTRNERRGMIQKKGDNMIKSDCAN